MLTRIPTAEDIQKAHERIAPYIHRTPVMRSQSLDKLVKASLYFKCENFQKCGAFKMRGASNAVFSLPSAVLEKGVATHSSGNHGAALALAAKLANTKAYVVMPKNSAKIKVEAVKEYGGEVVFCENTQAAREETLAEVVRQTGAHFIHPFDNYDVIAGQATAAKEFLEEVPSLEHLVVPVGGGGLLSGTALSRCYFSPQTIVWAGEPEGAPDTFLSFQQRKRIPNHTVATIADGLRANVGELTFPIIQKYVSHVILVSDEAIIQAIRLVWERLKIVIEPSCAVPLAAVLKEKARFEGKKVGIILSGGNVDLSKLPF
ncbi:MAG: threonine/serine dehydratase [Flammeovirgaceae bacterium]|nr:threonine/serine dehydratase [Flammeovirgaceae bacterium]